MKERKQLIFTGATLMLGSVILLLSAMSIPPPNSLSKGGEYMPKIMAFLLFLCSAGFILTGILSKKSADPEPKSQVQPMDMRQWSMFILEFLLICSYLLLLKRIGFLIMTTFFIFAQAWMITVKEERKPLKMIFVAVAVTSVTYFVFVKGFKLLLPAGLFG